MEIELCNLPQKCLKRRKHYSLIGTVQNSREKSRDYSLSGNLKWIKIHSAVISLMQGICTLKNYRIFFFHRSQFDLQFPLLFCLLGVCFSSPLLLTYTCCTNRKQPTSTLCSFTSRSSELFFLLSYSSA